MLKNTKTDADYWQKISRFCAYQERSHYEVREKLYSMGLHKQQVETLLTQLISEDYINEERFACAFARGKFSLKKWGRIKIKFELKQRRVSEFNIKIALKQVDEDQYNQVLYKLAAEKWASLKGEKSITRYAKTTSYLLQKGYEPPLVKAQLAKLQEQLKQA